MKNRLYGVLLTAFLSLTMVILLFFHVWRSPNHAFFANEGDGLKAYYGAIFHAEYDTMAMRTVAMNYPHGEMISFTDSQPLLVNFIRFFSETLTDITSHTVAIINIAMLLSVVLGAIFLLLLFCEAGTSWWYAAPVATGIALLSPQIARMGGHYSLAWVFWIPLMIWLIIRFDKSRWMIYTFLIGLVTLIAGFMHLYFVAFFGFLLGGYWFFRFFWYRKAGTFWYRDILHIFAQFVIPVLLLQFLIFLNDDVVDRPMWPFGLWSNLAHPVALFFPSSPPYGFVPKVLTVFNHISWESWSFIGSVAVLGFFTGIFMMVSKIFKKEATHRVVHIGIINILFWVSVFALFFSMGFPFILGLKEIAEQIGPLRQIRVLARFAWIFYYMINLVVFVALFRKAFVQPASLLWKIIGVVAVVMLWVEGVFFSHYVSKSIRNEVPGFSINAEPGQVERWILDIHPGDFQALIPLPYFHTGSENLWIDGGNDVVKTTMAVSLKTGLPTTGVLLSRTSISQTYQNYALHTEPLERLEFPDYLPDERPLLILLINGYTPSYPERIMLQEATRVSDTDRFALYSLPVSAIRRLNIIYREQVLEQYQQVPLTVVNNWNVLRSDLLFWTDSFDDRKYDNPFSGDGAYEFKSGDWRSFWQGTVNGSDEINQILISFWVKDYRSDAVMRTELGIIKDLLVEDDGPVNRFDFFSHIKAFKGNWALVEFQVPISAGESLIELVVRNRVLPSAEIVLDELMIRQVGQDLYRESEDWLIYNNRVVLMR